MEEKPTIEEPKDESVDDAGALLEELKKLNIETPKDVQNMAFASQEAGKAWNEVGALRKEVARLTELANQPKTDENYDYSESVDLGKVVEDKVQGVLNRYLQSQQQSQMMAMKIMNEVKTDPEYSIVGDVFEKYISSPEMVMKLQAGQTDYKTEYLNTKSAYYRNLAKRSADQIEQFMNKSQTQAPHMEKSTSQTTPMVNRDDEKVEKQKQIKKAQKEGTLSSDQALEQIVKSVMPDLEGDPSFYMP